MAQVLFNPADSFEENADFKRGIKLIPTSDAGAHEIPADCELRQIVD
jgi:hypothetical protein